MATIKPHDNLFTTVYRHGVELLRLSGSGYNDFADILQHIRRSASVAASGGMVTVNIRNASQGWASSRAVFLS